MGKVRVLLKCGYGEKTFIRLKADQVIYSSDGKLKVLRCGVLVAQYFPGYIVGYQWDKLPTQVAVSEQAELRVSGIAV